MELRRGPGGRMRKKLTSMIRGNNEKHSKLVRTLMPRLVVAMAYAPAPIKPAPPVPLPHAARAKCP